MGIQLIFFRKMRKLSLLFGDFLSYNMAVMILTPLIMHTIYFNMTVMAEISRLTIHNTSTSLALPVLFVKMNNSAESWNNKMIPIQTS